MAKSKKTPVTRPGEDPSEALRKATLPTRMGFRARCSKCGYEAEVLLTVEGEYLIGHHTSHGPGIGRPSSGKPCKGVGLAVDLLAMQAAHREASWNLGPAETAVHQAQQALGRAQIQLKEATEIHARTLKAINDLSQKGGGP